MNNCKCIPSSSCQPDLVENPVSVIVYLTSFKAVVDVFRAALSVEIFKQDRNVISDWSRNYSVLSFFSGTVKRAFLYHRSTDIFFLVARVEDVENHLINADLLLRQNVSNPAQLIDNVEDQLRWASESLALALDSLTDHSDVELRLLKDDESFCCFYFQSELERIEKKIGRFLKDRQKAHQKGQFNLCMELRLIFLILVFAAFFQRISSAPDVDLKEWFEKCKDLHENSLKLITFDRLSKSIERRIKCCSAFHGRSDDGFLEFAEQIVHTLNPKPPVAP